MLISYELICKFKQSNTKLYILSCLNLSHLIFKLFNMDFSFVCF